MAKILGSISFDRSRNKYQAAFPAPDGSRPKKRFHTHEEAHEWLVIQNAAVIQNEYISPSASPIGFELLNFVKTTKKNSIKVRTYERYLQTIANLKPIETIPLSKVESKDIAFLYDELLKKGYSPSSIQKVHRLLSPFLKKMVHDRIISRNPLFGVTPPQYKQKELETFSERDLKRICLRNRKSIYFPLAKLALFSGMRAGEVCGLWRIDLDFDKNIIFVRRNLQESQTQGVVLQTPKTSNSIRKITMPEWLMNERKELPQRSDYLFTQPNGNPITPNVLSKNWDKMLKKCKRVKYRSFHTLRHTHATELLRNGTPITVVSKRLGHSKVSTTLDIYSHVIPADDQIVLEKIDQIYNFGGNLGGKNDENRLKNTKNDTKKPE